MHRASLALIVFLVACGKTTTPDDGGTLDGDVDAQMDARIDTSMPMPCGNSTLDVGEMCDDGDHFGGDGCSATCQIEPGYACPTLGEACSKCGDGHVTGNELCDDGDAMGGDGCTADCATIEPHYQCYAEGTDCEECGDGFVDDHETCDDMNAVGNDGCSAQCIVESPWFCDVPGQACELCGDGTVDPNETCDDMDLLPGDGCGADCEVEVGWDCTFGECNAAECGDGYVGGVEGCDDGNRTSGDGCSYQCTREHGYVCFTPGFPCRATACDDGAVEGDETCDDAIVNGDGCTAACQLVPGWVCPDPNAACRMTMCGDGVVEGSETCDDANNPNPGCDASCHLEPLYQCPTPGAQCTSTTCGNGVVEGLETCDDANAATPGCNASCAVEPFYTCTGAPSTCSLRFSFVRIAEFAAPMDQPQSVHYDPRTRSFVAYGYDASQGYQEFCLDGTQIPNASRYRPRDMIGNALDGAAYDPFNDRFLFVRQNAQLVEFDARTGALVRTVTLTGMQLPGGVQVGDDGRLYVADQNAKSGDTAKQRRLYVFERFSLTATTSYIVSTENAYFDNIFNIPGQGLIGYYNRPLGANATGYKFGFMRYDGTFFGESTIPGTLFLNGRPFPFNADGGEAAVDGGYFLVCSEYLDADNNNMDEGICQLFARACSANSQCARDVPGTICKLDAMATEGVPPYCYAPAIARNDRFRVDVGSTANDLDVLRNDSVSEAVCTGADVNVTAVSMGNRGGTITIAAGDGSVLYSPAASFCGQGETFTYDADLGGITDTATVTVIVACVCGNHMVEAGEQCDDGGTAPDDGCSPTCDFEPQCGNGRLDPGEQCDEGDTLPNDGCSPTCSIELG